MKTSKSKLCLMIVILIVMCCFSAGILADEMDNPGADKILVDTENNTITFIYDENDEDLLRQWYALPSFVDVSEDAWYQMYVSYLTQIGVMEGVTETSFAPDAAITKNDFIRTAFLSENVNSITVKDDFESQMEEWIDDLEIEGFPYNDSETISRKDALDLLTNVLQLHYEQEPNVNVETIEKNIEDCRSLSGLIDENDNIIDENIELTRAETAKMLSGYIVFRDKPTFITGTTPIEYIEEDTNYDFVSDSTGLNDGDDSFHFLSDENKIINTRWTSSGDIYTSVHRNLTNQGFYILFNDKSSSVTNIYGKYSSTARGYIYDGSVAPDSDEVDWVNGKRTFKGHYCTPALKNKYLEDSPSAYTRFHIHYFNAKLGYSWGNYQYAYDELGRSIHYMEDINSPPHAAIITGDDHKSFENWVRDNYSAFTPSFNTSAPSSTYSFMTTTSFSGIAQGFATYSDSVASQCVYSHNQTKILECLNRCNRAVAGLAFRFLIDTGRNN